MMMMKKNGLIILLLVIAHITIAQTTGPWNNKRCAVVLTYDDAIDQHLDHAIPVLDSLDLKATFYITAFSPGCSGRIADWKKVGSHGHELANHTLYHPCVGGKGREWVQPHNDMNNYTVKRMEDEIRMTNVFLESLDGKKKRTFAFTCGDMKIHDTPFIDNLKKDFVAARAVRAQMHSLSEVDLYNVDCYMVNGETGAQLIAWAEQARKSGALLVILFHGVGGGNALNVSLAAHREFLHYLAKNEKDIWVAPMLDVADYINAKREQ